MIKKLMFFATMVAALFTSCSSEDDVTNNGVEPSNTRTLVILADLGEDTRLGFTADGNALKASFQEGDEIVYWTRKSATSPTGGPFRLYYKGMENGKGKFVGQVDGEDFPAETNNLHMLLSNGFTFTGTNLNVFDMSKQDGTLASAAKYSAYQCDFYFDESNKKVEGDFITLTGVKFSPKTSVIKFTLTKPDGADITTETPITVTAQDVYSSVGIGWGIPNTSSKPNKDGTGETTFTLKPGEINGNTITSYLTVWPSASENALLETRFDITLGIKSYQATVLRDNPTALTVGKVYRAKSAAIEYTGAVKQVVWAKDAAGVVVDNLTGYSAGTTASADWLSIEGGKISATENTTGAPRTGTIYVKDASGDEIPYEVTQVEPKDFKGSWSVKCKIFSKNSALVTAGTPGTKDVTFESPLKGETLEDVDGTKYTNQLGVKGLYCEAIMDATVDINYEEKTARVGMFLDARDNAQKVENGNAEGYTYAAFLPGMGTKTAQSRWAAPWNFQQSDLGEPDYCWLWFTIGENWNTLTYSPNHDAPAKYTLGAQSGQQFLETSGKMSANALCAITVSLFKSEKVNADNIRSGTVDSSKNITGDGWEAVYQGNALTGHDGIIFTRK